MPGPDRVTRGAAGGSGMRRVKNVLALVAAATALVGISTLTGCPKKIASFIPTKLEAKIVSSASLNPDPTGRASPVVVRFYELTDRNAFETADFFDLFDNEAATLGGDLVSRDEIQVEPGDRRKLERRLDDKTRYLGIIAAYRDLDNAEWRALVRIRSNHTNEFSIGLGGEAVTVVER